MMVTHVYFENISVEIAKELTAATRSIFIAVTWFTDHELFQILCDKARGGINVKLLVLDDSINKNRRGLQFDLLKRAGGEFYFVGTSEKLMHNKFCVIDYNITITGSYNWTNKAKTNPENIVVIKNSLETAIQYINKFNEIHKIAKFITGNKDHFQDYWDCYNIPWLTDNPQEDVMSNWPIPKNLPIDNTIALSLVVNNDKFGFANSNGDITISCLYDAASEFSEGLASVAICSDTTFSVDKSLQKTSERKKLKFGYIDKQGLLRIPYKYDIAGSFENGLATVGFGEDDHFERRDFVSQEKYFLEGKKKMGLIDVEGNLIVECVYENAIFFREELALVKKKGKYGFINRNGKVVLPLKYDIADNFIKGYARIGIIVGMQSVPFFRNEFWSEAEYVGPLDYIKEFPVFKYGLVDRDGNEYWDIESIEKILNPDRNENISLKFPSHIWEIEYITTIVGWEPAKKGSLTEFNEVFFKLGEIDEADFNREIHKQLKKETSIYLSSDSEYLLKEYNSLYKPVSEEDWRQYAPVLYLVMQYDKGFFPLQHKKDITDRLENILKDMIISHSLPTENNFLKKGNWCFHENNLEDAIRNYAKSIQLDAHGFLQISSKNDAYFGLAVAYYFMGDYSNSFASIKSFKNENGEFASKNSCVLFHLLKSKGFVEPLDE